MKSSARKTREPRETFALRPIACGVMLAFCGGALANPVGPQVAAGAAAFAGAGKTLTVTNAPGTIINWQSFSIGAGELTRFNQQSASSAVLNRVVGNDGSRILGALTSNGRVFLVNPHGIVFGAGSRIDTAGFIASTLNIADKDFLQGKLKFEGGGNGVLRNEGAIRASGDIVLVGPAIENTGLIRSDSGAVLLAAGRSVTISSPDAQGVKFELQAPGDTALNLGTIEASGAASMLAGTLRHSGDIRATSASVEGARVVLSAQKDAIVDAGASISANGARGGNVTIQSGDLTMVSGRVEATGSAGAGGTVQILGKRVGVFEGGSVDASGTTGGGTILAGGDYQGRNADLPNASQTIVASGTSLRADAIESGDGGKVIVWADNSTRFGGSISARGGAQSGDGGFVEVSGKRYLDFRGEVDTRAPNGKTGTLLLDPTTIDIVQVVSGLETEGSARNAPLDSRFQETGGTAPDISQLAVTKLQDQLKLSDVVISTESAGTGVGAINLNTQLDFDGVGTNRKLTLVADQNINLANPIVDSVAASADSLNLVLITRGVGSATNISHNVSLGPAGLIDASRDGTGVVNVVRGAAGPTVAITSPIRAQTVNFNYGTAGPATVVLGGAVAANAVNLQSGTLDVQTPGTGTLSRLTMTGGALARSIPGDLVIDGPFDVSGGSILPGPAPDMPFVTNGVTTVTGPVAVSRTWRNTNRLELGVPGDSAAQLNLLAGAIFRNEGTLNLVTEHATPFGTLGGGSIVNGGSAPGTINKISQGFNSIAVPFENGISGVVNINAGDLRVAAGLTQRGRIEIGAGTKLSTGGGSIQNLDGGVIGGNGMIDLAGGGLDNQGVLRPGGAPGSSVDPIGTLTIQGNLQLSAASSRVEIELRGINGDHDKINVVGNSFPVLLGGTLNVTHLNGFEPQVSMPEPNDRFRILTASGVISDDFITKRFPAGYIYNAAPEQGGYSLFLSLMPGTTTFTGVIDFSWDNPLNWDSGVPDENINAVIPDFAGTQTISIVAGDRKARKLTSAENVAVGAGTKLTLGAANSTTAGTLELQTNAVVSGALEVEAHGLLTANAMSVTGGTVSGAGRVAVTNTLTLNGATIASTGGVTAGGPVQFGLSQTNLTGALTLDVMNIDAALDVQAGGRLTLRPGLKVINPGAVLSVQNGGTVTIAGGDTNSLRNNGIILNGGRIELQAGDASIVSTSSGVLSSSGAIVNLGSGMLTIGDNNQLSLLNSGTLDARGVGGAIVYGAGGATQFVDGTRFIGPGAHRVTVNSSFGNVASNGLILEAGDFAGATATLNGTTTWTGGRIVGDFTFPVGSTLDINGSGAKSVVNGIDGNVGRITTNGLVNVNGSGNTLTSGAVWDNSGVVTFAGDARVTLDTGSVLRNLRDGFIHSVSNNPSVIVADATSGVSNAGTFGKNPDSLPIQAIDAAFSNTGIVNVRSGALELRGGNQGTGLGPDNGTYVVSDDAVLNVAGGSRDFAPGILLPLVGDGTLRLSGGSLDVRGGALPRLDMDGFATTLTRTTAGDLTIAGPFNIAGGTILGLGATDELVTQGNTTVTGLVTAISDWRNEGILTFAPSTGAGGQISPSPGAGFTFTNLSVVNLSTPQARPFGDPAPGPGSPQIINLGTFNKNPGGALDSEIPHAFTNNAGATINVNSGVLRLTSMPTNAGRIRTAANTSFATGGQQLTNLALGEVGGLGTIDLGNGVARLINDGTVIPGGSGAPPGPALTRGTLTISGGFTQNAGGETEVVLAPGGVSDRLAITGSATLDGRLDLVTAPNYVPANGDVFTPVTITGGATGSFSSITRTVANEVIPAYTASSVVVTLGPTNRNTWIFDGSGFWTDAGRWSQNRSPIASDDVVIDRPSGLFTITVPSGGAFSANNLKSEENITLAGTLGLATPSTINATLALNGGTLGGAGSVAVSGTTNVGEGQSQINTRLTTSGLSMTAGSLTVGAGGSLDLVGALPKTIANSTLTNSSTINLGGTTNLVMNGGAALNNNAGATLDIQSDVNIVRTDAAGAAPVLTNSGTIRKSGAAGNSTIGGGGAVLTSISSNGTYDVQSGTLTHAAANAFNDGTDFVGPGMNIVTTDSTFNGAITANGLTLQSGSYGGTASFGGTTAWTGGTMTGTFTVPSGSTLNLAGAGVKTVTTNSLTNNGVITFAGTGDLSLEAGAALNNNAGAVLDIQSNANVRRLVAGGGVPTLVNSGTIRKSGGAGNSTIGGGAGGALASTSNNGTYDVQSGMLTHAATNTFNEGTDFVGPGMNIVTTDSTFNGAITANGLTLQSGNYAGTASFGGTTAWTGGAMTGTFTVPGGSTLSLSGAAVKTVTGNSLTNNGTITLAGTGDLSLESGAALNNNAGAVLDIQSNANIRRVVGGSAVPTLVNSGTIRKSGGAGNSTIGGGAGGALTSTSNNGTYDVQSGTLTHAATNTFNEGTDFVGPGMNIVTTDSTFNGAITSTGLVLQSGNYAGTASFGGTTAWTGGNMTGAFTVPGGATLNVAGGGATTIAAAASLANAGTINLAGAQTINAAFSNTGRVNVNAGTLSLGGDGTDTGVYSIPAGSMLDLTAGVRNFNGAIALTGAGRLRSFATLNVNTPLTFANGGVAFDMNGGVLTGGNLTFNGPFNWNAGTIAGGGTLTTGATAVTTITGPVTLNGKLWDNFGPVALTGNSQIVLDGPAAVGATFVNRGTGVINDTSTNALPITTATTRDGKAFSNAGTFNKNAGSAATQTLDVPMTNTGTINVRSGTLAANGFPTNNGIIDLEPGTTLSTGALPFTNSPLGSITGNGTIVAAPFTNNGSLGPGDSPGTLTVAGNFVQGPTGTLVVELGGAVAGTTYDVLNVTGNATLGGALAIFVTPGETIAAGSTFDFMTYASRTGDFTTFAVPAGQVFQLAPGPTGYKVTATTPPAPVVMEVAKIAQNDVLVLAERRPDNFLIPVERQQQIDEKKSVGECK